MFRHSTFNRFIGTFYRPDKKSIAPTQLLTQCRIISFPPNINLILTQRRKQLVVLRL